MCEIKQFKHTVCLCEPPWTYAPLLTVYFEPVPHTVHRPTALLTNNYSLDNPISFKA